MTVFSFIDLNLSNASFDKFFKVVFLRIDSLTTFSIILLQYDLLIYSNNVSSVCLSGSLYSSITFSENFVQISSLAATSMLFFKFSVKSSICLW